MIPIEVVDEPSLEPCAICRRPTTLWTALPDRKPSEQVSCCHFCSKKHEPKDVPSKVQWFAREC